MKIHSVAKLLPNTPEARTNRSSVAPSFRQCQHNAIMIRLSNWGFLYDDNTGETQIAPVFDCGSCLLPQADEKVMRKVLSEEPELHARIYQFPTSAIKLRGRKINYYDFLSRGENEDCNDALARIVPRIDMEKIAQFIDRVEGITELQKQFYQHYLSARFDLIIRPAYEMAMMDHPTMEEPTM